MSRSLLEAYDKARRDAVEASRVYGDAWRGGAGPIKLAKLKHDYEMKRAALLKLKGN